MHRVVKCSVKEGSSSLCLSVITDLFHRAECYIIYMSGIQSQDPKQFSKKGHIGMHLFAGEKLIN